jgi:ABC-type transport system involved in cytochrome bd biosynthesis fused ATPase/permease subunit
VNDWWISFVFETKQKKANHHLQFSEEFDLIVVLHDGKQVQAGTFYELTQDKSNL